MRKIEGKRAREPEFSENYDQGLSVDPQNRHL